MRALRELARLAGVELESALTARASAGEAVERLLGVLRALGHDLAGAGGASEALKAERERRFARLLEPCSVLEPGRAGSVLARLPGARVPRCSAELLSLIHI